MRTAVTRVSRFLKLALLAAVCASLAPVAAGAAQASKGGAKTCWSGYSYTGVQSPTRANGISANLTLSTRSIVGVGHVAAWVGVGGAGMGPGGSDEWVQAGIAHDAGGQDVLYYEYKRPGDDKATYTQLQVANPGQSHSFVVYERAAQRDSWAVIVDGVKISPPVALPGSHGLFQPVATAENWDGGVAGTCNQYGYAFSNLAVRSEYKGTWQAFDLSRVLRDPGYQLALGKSGFKVSSRA
ncbi:MAG: hypothetical protein QOH13_2229 [Thermoleophilaceae bacterium]|nr:hypothetical protein [Thermoleophilaceae bacterium]